ncbi:conserved hypothetical protein [Histoplasma capsulatum var. duboisii H88]|uniref:Uncharacterized protein n=2 Tax=Ajellomyces capsulatus TaxID=5037 RepID=F0UQK2_AJEC8|nr:conserved hypothetical protein [Histoplasma capsulatum H143]EGC48179.1 conserved hypothetical protein [Histoplasma capsulatum var. duboisii H88]QSS50203.1 hypothetical protein I7I53_10808 [Histoplasma capsulatum var. duboisii H88]
MTPLTILTSLIAIVSAARITPQQYQPCGGYVVKPKPCQRGFICIDDPRKPGCGMACDIPGICIKPEFCGGIAGIACPEGKKCYDDPRDKCDPKKGGADCGGICL